ncbi:MAG TPA: hypothetical protein VMW77_04165, partial [Methanoregula sp.]|nr:hypothetical protein [Methanoregula sp.]
FFDSLPDSCLVFIIFVFSLLPGSKKSWTGNEFKAYAGLSLPHNDTPVALRVAPGVHVPFKYPFPDNYPDGEYPFQSYELRDGGW